MNNAEIQIQFPRPGNWQEFTLTAIYRDYDGYMHADRYTAGEIPADHAPAMAAVVTALVGLGEDWQASQVWARLGMVCTYDVADERYKYVLAVDLTVEAVNDQVGLQVFTSAQYQEFTITEPAAVEFFKFFTSK